MKTLIKNGTIIDPVDEKVTKKDILLENGLISKIAPRLNDNDANLIEAAGMLITPGLIDMHVHLRDPGFEYKEDIASGTAAAAAGGFTSVACMPNTNPAADNEAVIAYIKSTAAMRGRANVFPVGAITKGLKGDELAEMGFMKEAGAVAFTDDGHPVTNAGLMRRAMQYARMLGLAVIAHSEDRHLSDRGVMDEGYMSTVLGLPGIPALAEEVMIARDILLAEETGCHLHVAHISTAGAVRLVREGKARGVKVTAEVTPHHFTLTSAAVAGYHTSTKVNPPLRNQEDVDAIKEGLADGTIDVIASDHAPHTREEKEVEFALAPFGMVGLETSLGLVWTELVTPGILTPLQAITKMTLNPAAILGLDKGTLNCGATADLTIIDPDLEWTVTPELFAGKSRNTPFTGRKLKGKPTTTILAGQIVYSA